MSLVFARRLEVAATWREASTIAARSMGLFYRLDTFSRYSALKTATQSDPAGWRIVRLQMQYICKHGTCAARNGEIVGSLSNIYFCAELESFGKMRPCEDALLNE